MNKHYGEGVFKMVDEEGTKYRLNVKYNPLAVDPRVYDNVSTIWCWKRGYKIGDKVPNNMSFREALEFLCQKYNIKYNVSDSANELIDKIQNSKEITLKPISCYDHSYITISTKSGYPYNDRWDARIIGFAFVPKEFLWKGVDANNIIDSEVKLLDEYLKGENYYYTLEKKTHYYNEKKCPHCGKVIEIEDHDEWKTISSCEGFYGDCLETNGILDEINLKFEEE